MERTPSSTREAVDCRKTRLLGIDRLLVAENRRPLVQREERDEQPGQPFAEERLTSGEVERTCFMEPRDRVDRIVARDVGGALAR